MVTTGGACQQRERRSKFQWFCVVHGPKPPLHRHNWLSFGKLQDTERFLIPCPRHVSSRMPLAAKPARIPWRLLPNKKTLRDSLPIDMLLSAVSVSVVALPISEILEGLMNYPVFMVEDDTPTVTPLYVATHPKILHPHRCVNFKSYTSTTFRSVHKLFN
jgi:hypothetical protein